MSKALDWIVPFNLMGFAAVSGVLVSTDSPTVGNVAFLAGTYLVFGIGASMLTTMLHRKG